MGILILKRRLNSVLDMLTGSWGWDSQVAMAGDSQERWSETQTWDADVEGLGMETTVVIT